MGVDNATIEVDGPEVPIMDGSAAAFVAAIDQAGIVTQSATRRFIQVLKPVQVAIGDSFGELRPHANGFRAEVEIDFANPVIGRQNFTFDLSAESFRRDVSRARTFGFMNEVARLWNAGFARGASFENTVVFDEARLHNAEGLRYSDECVRHKVLDVIGDLALAGLPLQGVYRSVRGGHKLNHAVLTALLADHSAWRVVEAEPARRSRSHAEAGAGMVGGMIAPAYGPDVLPEFRLRDGVRAPPSPSRSGAHRLIFNVSLLPHGWCGRSCFVFEIPRLFRLESRLRLWPARFPQ